MRNQPLTLFQTLRAREALRAWRRGDFERNEE
jgi:hypothetical protein